MRANPREFEKDIHQCGFYRAKTKNILAAAKVVKEKFHGKLPKTMAEMTTIPGVGRKSANVILGNAYGVVEGIAVDTHVKRLARVLGLSKERTPEKIEQDLMQIVPRKDWFRATYEIMNTAKILRCSSAPARRVPAVHLPPLLTWYNKSMKKKTKFVAVSVAMLIVIGVLAWWGFASQKIQREVAKPTFAPIGQLAPGFPKDLILDSLAQISGSYAINYSPTLNQIRRTGRPAPRSMTSTIST